MALTGADGPVHYSHHSHCVVLSFVDWAVGVALTGAGGPVDYSQVFIVLFIDWGGGGGGWQT